MNLDWYHWMILSLLALSLAWESRTLYRDAKHTKFSLFNLVQMMLSIGGIVAILAYGAR